MTSSGNSKTTPSGTEIFDRPFNRIRRLKNESRKAGGSRCFSLLMSLRVGIEGEVENPLTMFLMKPMMGAFLFGGQSR